MKFTCLIILTLCFQACRPFKQLAGEIGPQTKMVGVYSNDCDSVDKKYATKKQLWNTIDKKYTGEKTGLTVHIQENKNKLFAQLIDHDTIVCEKTIRGHFKNDQCYYKRRFFYLVPILPVLWWYKNIQTRIYRSHDYLVLEEKYEAGGVVIIMAGGNTSNINRLYRRIK